MFGLGRNAHIDFDEPGSSFYSRTRLVSLAPTTIAANASFFGPRQIIPARAISMGIATIIAARRIVVLASGTAKAAVVHAVLNDPPISDVPGSALQLAGAVAFVLDPDAHGD